MLETNRKVAQCVCVCVCLHSALGQKGQQDRCGGEARQGPGLRERS